MPSRDKNRRAEVCREFKKRHRGNLKKWEKANPEKARGIRKKSEIKSIQNLSDNYVKKQLKARGEPITPASIELKRLKLLTKRIISQIKRKKK